MDWRLRGTKQAQLPDLAKDAIFVRDASDRITYGSRRAEETYGFSREEPLGHKREAVGFVRHPTKPVRVGALERALEEALPCAARITSSSAGPRGHS